MKKPTRKKKSKLYRTLETGNLLFNFFMSMWFVFMWLIFGSVFKMIFSYKVAIFIYFSVSSFLLLNLGSKILDIGTEYFKESLSAKIFREIEQKKKIKPKP